ncbi:MAG: molybdopterin-dependent oxidoreductase [Pseudomonadota bacterium]
MSDDPNGRVVRTTCAYCGVGCGVLAERFGDVVSTTGDPDHPANHGRLCAKGIQLGSTLRQDSRLLHPLVDGVEASWDKALARVAHSFRKTIAEHGPDSVAFYVSGQLLTEDYYVANKLMKGAIGSGNIDTNSRLCMATAVAGYKRAFGSDTVPCGYADVEQADLVVLVGSNLAWCHPVLHQRLDASRASGRGPVVVCLDPRPTATSADADLHLSLKPGTDAVLFNGLLNWLNEHDAVHRDYVSKHTTGFAQTLAAAQQMGDPAAVAQVCGLRVADVEALYQLFSKSDRVVTLYSQGVNQSSVGTDKVNAIINVHLATAQLGRPGCGPFSITGQPNAMGGREVGGLASQLAAHMGFEAESVDRVRRFWGFDRIAEKPGYTAVELFDRVAKGDVKALWIMGTNPAVSMPNSGHVREALRQCPLVVLSDCVASTDTAAFAHIQLPAAGWGEKDGTVTNSERMISRQRRFLPTAGACRPDWWIITEVARAMGYAEHFDYTCTADIFREHAALSTFENNGSRDFDLGGLANLSNDAYESLEPLYWPVPDAPRDSAPAAKPHDMFAAGRFFTPDRRARLVPVTRSGIYRDADESFPVLLNSGRLRDQWHTMTRTAEAPKLNQHTPEPMVYLSPLDGRRHGLSDGDIANVRSRCGQARLRVCLSPGMSPGQAFVPMHWSDQFASSALSGSLFSGPVDPLSAQPELKSEPVRVERFEVVRHALVLRRQAQPLAPLVTEADYFARSRFADCEVIFLAFGADRSCWETWAGGHLPDGLQTLSAAQSNRGLLLAALSENVVEGVVLLSKAPVHRQVHRLAGYFAFEPLTVAQRQQLLGGLPSTEVSADGEGEVICACFGTTSDAIDVGIESAGLRSTEALGDALGAGSNCGSCLPELRQRISSKD